MAVPVFVRAKREKPTTRLPQPLEADSIGLMARLPESRAISPALCPERGRSCFGHPV